MIINDIFYNVDLDRIRKFECHWRGLEVCNIVYIFNYE